MGTFLKMMSGTTSQPKLKKYREMKDYTAEQMKSWLFQNFKLDEIVELCAYLILDELNNDDITPITISQEEFEKHFRIRKPQQNPMRSKSEYNKAIRENK
jgi:hypothetical protein